MESEFRVYLESRKATPEKIEFAITVVKDFEDYLRKEKIALEGAELNVLKKYMSLLISEGSNSEERLVAIARYCYFVKKNDFFVYIAGIVNGREVLPGVGMRLGKAAGEDVRARVFEGVELPPLGAPQEAYPVLTNLIMERMERELSPQKCREVLTWNYHEIPSAAFLGHRKRFDKANTLDDYLRNEHERFIEELARFMNEGRVWYEQEITPEVIEFVEGNQEISVGKRVRDRIFVTKIPFAPKQYLEEKDPTMRRYYACHCPLARTAIRDGGPKIPSTFCYCSAGFTKVAYDVIFGESVEIEMLESALDGDQRCRFAIKIPEGKMK
ncbi:MAG: hypothetical protein LUQ27_07145 [Methanomassiliicoccales archaeon]|nr:hypothetical protein [Methanomassiliicoccales archaeon]